MKLSNRITNMPASAVRNRNAIAADVQSKGIEVFKLNIGDSDIKTPRDFFDGIAAYGKEAVYLPYAASEGLPMFVDAVVDYYNKIGLDYKKEDILVTNGGSEALTFLMKTLCDIGEEILVFEPFYYNYNGFSDAESVNVVSVPTSSENGFHLPDKETILSKITDKTRAILFSNPGNPTGTVYTKEEVEMLADIALEKDLWLISDEVYREFIFDGLTYTSPASIDKVKDRVIIVDSISKRYCSCGARIGNIACKNPDFIAQYLKLCQNRLSVSTLDQVGATSLYKMDQGFLAEARDEYDARRNVMYNELEGQAGIKFIKPQGAFYLILDLPVKNASDFSLWLLKDFHVNNETVMLAPAAGFYKTEGAGLNQVRLAYVVDCDKLKRSANIIKLGLEEYIKNVEK